MMEFTRPQTLTAKYRITTPMFLGGEGQQVDKKQFRNASFKGALRFWWRALNWGRLLKAAGGEPTQALKALHDEEGRLFGLASDGKDSRQSLVQISSELASEESAEKVQLSQVGYLLGQGLYHFRDGVLRGYIAAGKVLVNVQLKPQASVQDFHSVRQALIALGVFGALGSRARKGLGSLSIESISAPGAAEARFTTREAIRDFIGSIDFSAAPGAPLSAFTANTRIDISAVAKTGLSTLVAINREMQLYRSYGQKGRVNGGAARRNFVSDHDNVLAATQGQSLKDLPVRAVFGLPHNYFFSSTKAKLDINPANEGRRASPLFIHIHALDDNEFVAIQTLLPGEFLPQGMTIDVKTRRTQLLSNPKVDFQVIERYLDGFGAREHLRTRNRG